jgi:hypothetical protein
MNLRTTNALCATMRDLFNKNVLTTYEYVAFKTMCINLSNNNYSYNRDKEFFEEIPQKTKKMKELNLYKIWEIMNKLSNTMDMLSEEDKYFYLLGHQSSYSEMSFEGFLEYYSFKIDGDNIIIFNDDSVAWENFTVNDFSYIPICLLSFSAEKLESWIEVEIDLQLEKQKREKLQELENKKAQIAKLQKEVDNFGKKN